MARPRYPRSEGPLPPPLPPAERTVGQLVAESIRLYGRRFWSSLLLGTSAAAFAVGAAELEGRVRAAFVLAVAPLLLAASLTGAVFIATRQPPRFVPTAILLGAISLLPLAASRLYVFPGVYLVALAWFALVGLSVPAALVERTSFGNALVRGTRLARADFIHAFGSIATFAILVVVCLFVLFILLQGFGDQTPAVAAFLGLLVTSPLFFLGAALLYYDQEARAAISPREPRVRSSRR